MARLTLISAVLLALLAAAAGSAAAAPDAGFYQPPAYPRDFPDPSVIRYRGRYFAYGTATAWERPGAFPILRSADLTDWRYVGSALRARDLDRFSTGAWWAPAPLVRPGGRTLLYFTEMDRSARHHCVAVASARTPRGPFTTRRVITCGDDTSVGAIDPWPVESPDGRLFLYLATDQPHGISVVELAPDGLSAAGPRTQVLTPDETWVQGTRQTVEAPSVVVAGGRFYLFYSGNDWRADYGMGVAAARTPYGPFEQAPGNPFLRGTSRLVGPGGGSVFTDERGRRWLAYHAWTRGLDYAHGGVRALRLIRFGMRGRTVHLVTP